MSGQAKRRTPVARQTSDSGTHEKAKPVATEVLDFYERALVRDLPGAHAACLAAMRRYPRIPWQGFAQAYEKTYLTRHAEGWEGRFMGPDATARFALFALAAHLGVHAQDNDPKATVSALAINVYHVAVRGKDRRMPGKREAWQINYEALRRSILRELDDYGPSLADGGALEERSGGLPAEWQEIFAPAQVQS